MKRTGSGKKENRMDVLVLAVLLAVFFPVFPAQAAERDIKGPVNIEADQLSYDKEEDVYRAQGNVIITFTDGFLIADSVIYDRKTDDAFAEGDVFILNKADTLEGDRVRFNLTSKTGIVYQGKAFFADNHLYLKGKEIEKIGEASYHLLDATATTCDGDRPSWRFTGRELDVTVEGYGTLKGGTFDVQNVPVLYSPYMIFPAKTKRQTGLLLPQVSYSKDINGLDVEVPFYWAISDSADATFYQRYLEKRGLKEGMELRYFASKDSFGTLYVDYLNDVKEVSEVQDNLARNWTGNQRRWSLYWNHETTFSPGFYARTDIAKVSDIWYFRDFSSYNYYLDNYSQTGANKFQRVSFFADKSLPALDSTARIVKDWSTYNLTGLVRYTENLGSPNNDATAQSYPLITFTGVNQPLFKSPVNFSLSSYYQYVYRVEGEKGHVMDANPVFSLPHSFGDYLQVTPSLGLRETAWEGRGGVEDKNANRELYTLGLDASTEVSRVFDVNAGSINKIRHSIKPQVVYSYIPNVDKGNIPDFVPAVSETNTVTYSLTNTIMAKVKETVKPKEAKAKEGGGKEAATDQKAAGEEKKLDKLVPEKFTYIEFLRFMVSQTFDIKEYRSSKPEADRRPLSPVNMELNITPQKYLSYRGLATFDTNDGEWKTINHDLTVSDWRGDSATIGYRYTQDSLEEIDLNFNIKATDSLNLIYIQRRNRLDGKDLEKTYGIEYKKQCWSMELTYSDLDDDQRIMAVFYLYGLGKVGGFQATPGTLMGRRQQQ